MAYGTLGIDTIQTSTANTLPAVKDGSGNSIGTFCRAYVLWNGSTSVVSGSFNVSSVTRNGTGDYSINFTNAMPDTNFADVGGGGKWSDGVNFGGYTQVPYTISTSKTTSVGRMYCCYPTTGVNTDPTYVTYMAFR